MQSAEEKVPYLLERLQLSRFQLKEHRNLDDREYRLPGFSSKTHPKIIEIIYRHQFTHDHLVTHFELQLKDKGIFHQFFEIGQIEASKLTNRGMMGSVLRSSSPKYSNDSKSMNISCVGITQTLQLSLLLKKDFIGYFGESLELRKEKGKHAQQQNILKMIRHTFKTLNICGYQLSMNTAASELISLLNISQTFKHQNRLDEAAQTDILVSLSLISARRFVQASETLRAASKFYVEKYISSKSSMEFSRIDKSWMKEQNRDFQDASGFSRTFTSGRVLEGGRYLYKAAKIELLLADTINQPTLIGQKLQAFNRANSFSNGNTSPPPIQPRIDYQSVSYSIGPSIIPFLVKVLTDKSEIFKISALKALQFFYETLGCSLGNFMPIIVKTLIGVYPPKKEELTLKTEQWLTEKTQTNSRTKLLLDNFNHLFQSLLSLLPGMNKKCLKMIFEEIIQVSLSEEYRNELRLYLLRFGERIIQICGADLQISVNYIQYVFTVIEGKYSKQDSKQVENNKHVSHNLVHFSNRTFELIRSKVLRHDNKFSNLSSIANWIHEQLINLCENQNISSSLQLGNLLDLVISIYSNPRGPLPSPIQPIIYILNTSLNEPKLPFQKILEVFVVLVQYSARFQGGSDLAFEIVQRVLGRAKLCTLTSKQLTILQKVLRTTNEARKQWLYQFLECIPHSNFDQIYVVFDLLVMRSVKLFEKSTITLIIQRLFDQYTVKGKAHQHSKQQFITTLIQQLPGSLQLFLDICLFQNQEPKLSEYKSKTKKQKQHGFDSKQYKLHSELFLDKINLLLLVFSKQELVFQQFSSIFTNQNIFKFYSSLKNIFEKSHSFKIKSKILLLIKQFLMLAGAQLKQCFLPCKIFMTRAFLDLLNSFSNLYRDSKLQYYVLLNIGLIFQQLSKEDNSESKKREQNIDFLDQQITESFKVPKNVPCSSYIIGHQILKLWSNLIPLLNSPLQNVRQMLTYILLFAFRRGITTMPISIREKLSEILKNLISSCLQSTDYSERLLGVRLLALIIGLGSQDYQIQLKKRVKPFKKLLEATVKLEDDWNQQISTCSKLVTKVSISKQHRAYLHKKMKSGRKNSNHFLESSNLSFSLDQELIFQKKVHSFDILNNFDNILKSDEDFQPDQSIDAPQFNSEWIIEVQEFRHKIQKIRFNAMEHMPERDSFIQQQQNYFDHNQERHSEKQDNLSRSEQEQLQFEDLGIIELDDEEWGQQQNQLKITQKLPLKKVYKLSPNLGSSTKHHRLRNQRSHPPDFQQNKIIVDEIQQRIYSPHPQQNASHSISIPPPLPAGQSIYMPQRKGWINEERKKFEQTEVERRGSLSDDSGVHEVRNLRKEKKGTKKRKSSTLR